MRNATPSKSNMSNRVVVLICRFIRAAALGKSDDDAAA